MSQKLQELHKKFVKRKEQHQAEVDEVVQAIFDERENITNIFVTGTTPYFNDGDACVHRQEVAFNIDVGLPSADSSNNEDEVFEDWIFDESGEPRSLDNGRCWEVLQTGRVSGTAADAEFTFELMHSLEGHFRALYDTNFYILFLRNEDGKTYRTIQEGANEGY